VREIAETLQQAVLQSHPHSFSDKKYEATEVYLEQSKDHYYYHNTKTPAFACCSDHLDRDGLHAYISLINARPNGKTELPTFLDAL
jgi:hypothetical protein